MYAYCSRSELHIVDSLGLLASLIHPDLVANWGPPDAVQTVDTHVLWHRKMEQEHYASS